MTKGIKPTAEEIALWSGMLDDGMGYQHIAEVLKVSKHTVRRYLPGRGWTPTAIRQHGTFVKNVNEKIRKVERRNKVAVPHDPANDPELTMMNRRAAGRSQHRHQDR